MNPNVEMFYIAEEKQNKMPVTKMGRAELLLLSFGAPGTAARRLPRVGGTEGPWAIKRLASSPALRFQNLGNGTTLLYHTHLENVRFFPFLFLSFLFPSASSSLFLRRILIPNSFILPLPNIWASVLFNHLSDFKPWQACWDQTDCCV